MTHDAADPEVIRNSPWAHNYARLYFGPNTPTQYWMEGIRPQDRRRHGAHCPVPVFLVFDSRSLLVRDDCEFSNGNVASPRCDIAKDAGSFCALPFRQIYHRGAFDPNSAAGISIIFHRCAEVLFRDELDLSALVDVVCRSSAERETLLHLLGREQARAWAGRVRLERPGEGFFRRSYYWVQDVRLIDGEIVAQFGVGDQAPSGGIRELGMQMRVSYPNGRDVTLRPSRRDPLTARFRLDQPADRISVELEVIDSMAYRARLAQTARLYGS